VISRVNADIEHGASPAAAPERVRSVLRSRATYAGPMGKQKKPGDATTPAGSPEGPPGKKQRSKARKNAKGRG